MLALFLAYCILSGFNGQVAVVSTGSDMPGTILGDCSEDFVRLFGSAAVIVAKGQANYESLSDHPGPIFLLLKAKCPVIAADIGCQVGSLVMRRSTLSTVSAGDG